MINTYQIPVNANTDQMLLALFSSIGEALCHTQHLEDALSHSIVIKKYFRAPGSMTRDEAESILEQYRRYTLGRAIKVVQQHAFYNQDTLRALQEALELRNWLVHRSISQRPDHIPSRQALMDLTIKVREVGQKIKSLQISVEKDLIEYSKSHGLDTTMIEKAMNKLYENY